MTTGHLVSQVLTKNGIAGRILTAGTQLEPVEKVLGPATEHAAVAIETRVELPAGARLERAAFTIQAAPAGEAAIKSVATVRTGETDQACVVDFGRMIAVRAFEIRYDDDTVEVVKSLMRWSGDRWRSVGEPGSFMELTTERLRVEVETEQETTAANLVREHGFACLAAPPGALELAVHGTTVWFERQGSAPDLVPANPTESPDGTRSFYVDRTDAVRDALARARPREEDGARAAIVTLRAGTPGTLMLTPAVLQLHEHAVAFGTSALSATVDAPEEGTRTLDLDGPYGPQDAVREVAVTVTGSFGPERVEPVDGPPVDGDAELVLGPGRVPLLGVPSSTAARFGELTGIRLLLASPRGGELGARLLAADGPGGGPGLALPGAQLPATPVPSGHDGWFTLTLPEPVSLAANEGDPVAAWLELLPSYGEIRCALTTATGPEAPGAPVRRRLSGGGSKPLSTLRGTRDAGEETTLLACLRVVGRPGPGQPLPAVALSVPGAPGAALTDPTGDALRVLLRLGSGVTAPGGAVPLRLRLGAPGTVTADDVVVSYRKDGEA